MAKGDQHYDVEVNKGSLNVAALTVNLSRRWNDGWRLDQVFEQNGNTVLIFERRD